MGKGCMFERMDSPGLVTGYRDPRPHFGLPIPPNVEQFLHYCLQVFRSSIPVNDPVPSVLRELRLLRS